MHLAFPPLLGLVLTLFGSGPLAAGEPLAVRPAPSAGRGIDRPRPRVVDLSESGDALSFRVAADGAVEVRPRAVEPWERLEFEVRDAVGGSRMSFRCAPIPAGDGGLPAGAHGARARSQTTVPLGLPHLAHGGGPWMPIAGATPGADGGVAFTVVVPAERFSVRLREPTFAASPDAAPYYTWETFVQWFANIQAEPLADVVQLGTSIQGRPIYRVLIDDPAYPAAGKKTVVMVVRQHGDEYASSYFLQGTLDLLLGRSGLKPDPDLRRKVRWIVFPLFNPDGAFLNIRTNVNGVDLNRDWDRTGCNGGQQIETFLQQCELESLHALFGGVHIGGDHHGWGNFQHGGYRYANGQPPSSVTTPEYLEARKDTQVVTLHDPTQVLWQENGGTTGMFRVEMYKEFGFLNHTPEYNGGISTAQQFYQKGIGWAEAMLDTLYAPAITDATGRVRTTVKLPADAIWVTVDDFDSNDKSGVVETVQVLVTDSKTGDAESLVLLETGANTGVFRNTSPLPFQVSQGAPTPGDGTLESAAGSRVTASYVDADYPPDQSTATATAIWATPFEVVD